MRDPDPAAPSASDAPVVVSSARGSFPWSVLAERHPALLRKVAEALPYGPEQRRALAGLLTDSTEGVIEPLPASAPDRARWDAWGGEAYYGRSWFDVPFLWSESYFYRRLLEAVGYFSPGPWQGVDPFRPFKLAELETAEADAELAALDDLATRPVQEQEQALLHGVALGQPGRPRVPAADRRRRVRRRPAPDSSPTTARRLRSLLAGPGTALPGRRQRGPRTRPRPAARRPPAAPPAAPGGPSCT